MIFFSTADFFFQKKKNLSGLASRSRISDTLAVSMECKKYHLYFTLFNSLHACILHIFFFILLITLLSSADFFLKKSLPGYYLQCETVLIQIQPHILLGPIWIQLVCIWITIDYKICPGWQ